MHYSLVFGYAATLIFQNSLTLPDKPDNPVLSYTCLFFFFFKLTITNTHKSLLVDHGRAFHLQDIMEILLFP